MRTASPPFANATRTCGAVASTSVCTATVAIPSRSQVRITRSAISPRLATRTLLNITCGHLQCVGCGGLDPPVATSFVGRTARSHPEDAVGRRRDRGVGGGGQPHAEDPAGVDGIDHAVVPEPGGGVVRRALGVVL